MLKVCCVNFAMVLHCYALWLVDKIYTTFSTKWEAKPIPIKLIWLACVHLFIALVCICGDCLTPLIWKLLLYCFYNHLLMSSGVVNGWQLVPEYTLHLGVCRLTEFNTLFSGSCADFISFVWNAPLTGISWALLILCW